MSRDIQLIARLTRLASDLASGRVVIEDEVRTQLEELLDHVLHHDFDR